MLSAEIRVSSNLVSYRERAANQIPGNSNFVWKLGSSFCYHKISVRTCFCVYICLIFRFACLAYFCFSAMLFSISHLSIVDIFCCLCYILGVYLKSPMLCLRCVYCLLFSKNRWVAQYLTCSIYFVVSGPNLDLFCVRLSKAAPFCKN